MSPALRVLGAARTVTGSAHLLELDHASVLVDCGLFQGVPGASERNRVAPVERPAELSAVVLTHGHLDHVGRLPLLMQGGFDGPVLGHPATLAIAEIVMRDAAKIAEHHGGGGPTVADVEATVKRFEPLAYRKPHVLAEAKVTLFEAGHILGSASVLVETAGCNVLFSGDLGRSTTPLLRAPNTQYPEGLRIDHVLVESTYGDREHPTGPSIRERLRDVLRKALEDGGKVLVPAFAVGRTQELLYHLRGLITDGELAEVPVVVDGPMGLDVTALYEKYTGDYDAEAHALLRSGTPPLSFDTLYSARGGKGSEAARSIPGAAIIVAGSGMCTGGRILAHLEELLPDERTDVLFVGYQARGTLGRQLLDGASEVELEGRTIPVRARIHCVPGLSAHADKKELLAWLAAVPGGPKTYVTHGEPEASAELAGAAERDLGLRAVVPDEGERFDLAG
jgi:metallo-beta-lactamase family protein